MENLTDVKKLSETLKRIRLEKNISFDQLIKMIEENGDSVSKNTLSRFFSDDSDYTDFRFNSTIRPIATALLGLDKIEQDDDNDTQAYKEMLKLKKEIIEELTKANEQTKIDYAMKLQEETEKFQRSMDFVRNQIVLKDERITDLLLINKELTQANIKLIAQLMDCPLRKDCE